MASRKRPEDRRNRVTKDVGLGGRDVGVVRVPRARQVWDARTRKWFNGVKKSPIVEVYSQSDWDTLLVAGDILDRWYSNSRAGATLLTEWRSLVASLLLVEGDRKRAGVDLGDDRGEALRALHGAAAASDYRQRLGLVR